MLQFDVLGGVVASRSQRVLGFIPLDANCPVTKLQLIRASAGDTHSLARSGIV